MTGRFRLFPQRVGQDVRAWPTLALLLLVVLMAIGCVLWFMREAMRNEQMAVRGKLAEVYRGHLSLVRTQSIDRWNRWREQLDGVEPAAERFARIVMDRIADSAVCLDGNGRIAYPRAPQPREAAAPSDVPDRVRELLESKKIDEAIELARSALAPGDQAVDTQGRLIAANVELLLLETLGNHTDPRFRAIADRLHARVADYAADALPSAQRRFVMREMQRLDPGVEFPTLGAEEIAAGFLETNPDFTKQTSLAATSLPDLWIMPSVNRRVFALLSTASLREKLSEAIREVPLSSGTRIAPLAAGEEPGGDSAPIVVALGNEFPGWRLALTFDDHTLFDAETAKRLQFHIFVACAVIAALSALSIVLARSFGQQVKLARLKNDLVATVSHELKTPLTAMRALVETLLESETLDEKTTREYLQLLASENTRLSRLIENFLTFSRLERNKFNFTFASVTPAQIVGNAVAAFGERAHQPGCTFETKLADDLPAIRADADALTTALLNLLDNAWKYSGDEKRVTLRAERSNGSVRFAVEDNGLGLEPREHSRVFQRFYQADQRLARAAGGCGLGLSIVSSIVSAHRGKVSVASEPGRGSIFTVEIPA